MAKRRQRVYLVTAKLSYDENDLKAAMEWSKKNKYTYIRYIRDKEYAAMLLGAEHAGIINGSIEEAYLDEY